MTDVQELEKKNKRKKKIVRDKKTYEIVESCYVVPKNIELEKYQSELYK